MKSVFKVLLLLSSTLALSLMLAACRDLDGKLEVKRSFALIDDDGDEVIINEGKYRAELEFDTSDKELEFTVKDVAGDEDFEFDFNIPDAESFDFDDFDDIAGVLTPDQSGQPVQIALMASHKVVKRSRARIRILRGGGCGSVLGTPTIVRTEKRVIKATLVFHNEGDLEESATFNGEMRYSKIVTLWKGECGDPEPEWREE